MLDKIIIRSDGFNAMSSVNICKLGLDIMSITVVFIL